MSITRMSKVYLMVLPLGLIYMLDPRGVAFFQGHVGLYRVTAQGDTLVTQTNYLDVVGSQVSS